MDKAIITQVDEESKESTPIGDSQPRETKKGKGAFSKISRELTEQDLSSPGTQRLILNELDKYEECKIQLEFYREKYYERDKSCAVYSQMLKSSRLFEVICSTMLATGPAMMSLSPSIVDKDGNWYYLSTIILVLGGIVLLSGIVAKLLQHSKI